MSAPSRKTVRTAARAGRGAPGSAPASETAPVGGASRSPSLAERRFYGPGTEVVEPASYEELREALLGAAAAGRTVIPSGLGNHAYLGNPPPEAPLVISLRRLDRILRYEPGDFTAGVQAGAHLSALRDRLAENGQEIPVDFPAAPAGTIGGASASLRHGPRRGRYGTYRNYVIGIAGMRADGSIYRSGGMVVKNVAGYDIHKYLLGSLGTLGIILEINFKLRPLARARSGRLAAFDSLAEAWEFAGELLNGRLDPAVLAVLDAPAAAALAGALENGPGEASGAGLNRPAAAWLYEGNPGAVSYQERSVDEILARRPARAVLPLEGAGIAGALEQLSAFQEPDSVDSPDLAILRLATVPSRTRGLQEGVLAAAGAAGMREPASAADASCGSVVARARGDAEAMRRFIAGVREALARSGGGGRILFAPPEVLRAGDFLLLPDPNRRLALRLERAFDPEGIFHPGRITRLR